MRRARRLLAAADDNAGIMLHERRIDPDTVKQHYRRWTVETDDRIDKKMEFLLHPVWRAYGSIYEAGERLVEGWTAGNPARFHRLLSEQLVPVRPDSRLKDMPGARRRLKSPINPND